MKLFGFFFIISLLAGCASSGGGADGTPQLDSTHAQASARIHTELAATYYDRTQYGVALQEVAAALHAVDDFAPAFNVRALVRVALHEDDKANEDFLHSLRLDNSNSDTHNNYGWFLCKRGHFKEAIKQFQEALSNPLYATPEMTYTNLGNCYKQAGQFKNAEDNLQRALALRPDMPQALYGLAELSYAGGNYPVANSYFKRYEQAGTELSAEQLWLAVRIQRKLNDYNSEASYALQLRKRFPNAPETQTMLNEK
jgi:type IV pilus assembly protein PilF